MTVRPDEPILHISLPVRDLGEARRFYVDVLGCELGRVREQYVDVFFFGCQVTLHQRPTEVLSSDQRGVRHFGVTLVEAQWNELIDRLRASATPFVRDPTTDYAGTPREQRKAMVADPSGNAIEIKTYRDRWTALELPGSPSAPETPGSAASSTGP
ncbi:MAG TPA: VOC family protein [Acidimicrobiales bacterium]|nr:VOC family protein [Acidimicrobiales bacterium]